MAPVIILDSQQLAEPCGGISGDTLRKVGDAVWTVPYGYAGYLAGMPFRTRGKIIGTVLGAGLGAGIHDLVFRLAPRVRQAGG